MSGLAIPTGSSAAQKVVASTLYQEAVKEQHFESLLGEDRAIMRKDDLQKGAGDQITFHLMNIAQGVGRLEGQVLEGYEATPAIYSDALLLGQLRHAVRTKSENTIDQQRVPFNIDDSSYTSLKNWLATRMEIWTMHTLGGNTATSFTVNGDTFTSGTAAAATGLNTATAPTANRVIRAGAQANDQSLTSADTMTLSLIDSAIVKARSVRPTIKPINYNGDQVYLCIISPEQERDLLQDTSAPAQLLDLYNSRAQGGDIKDNPLFGGRAKYRYRNVIFAVSDFLPQGVSAADSSAVANTKRALFLGQGAGCYATGSKGAGNVPVTVASKYHDYDEEYGVALRIVAGLIKTVFNSEDYGMLTISTYAAS